jgi:hypothetical protein
LEVTLACVIEAQYTMTSTTSSSVEVKESSCGHLGLFATQELNAGDLILEEEPLVILAPLTEEESNKILLDWMGVVGGDGTSKKRSSSTASKANGGGTETPSTLWDVMKNPESVPVHMHGTFKGMVQAGLVWMTKYQNSSDCNTQEALLKLYHPGKGSTTDVETPIVKLADVAIKYLQDSMTNTINNNNNSNDVTNFKDWELLNDILLIWACNSFQGGRVYDQISRANHDCNPNAIIQTIPSPGSTNPTNNNNMSTTTMNDDGQRLVAATKIAPGDEICISYLGLLLYTEREVRKAKLKNTKFFDCQCVRCTKTSSTAGSVDPAGRIPCPARHPRQTSQLVLDEDVQYDDDQTVTYTQTTNIGDDDKNKRLVKVCQNVNNAVLSFLDSRAELSKQGRKPRTTPTSSKRNSRQSTDDDDDDDDDENAVLGEHVGLASTMMGDKHWTTNLTLLLHLDDRLSTMSSRMVATQELPDLDDIAEAIDSLQRISRFVESLDLLLDPGHLLGDVTIGIARLLVSLGDEKSQKYGAEWLDKINDYVTKFGTDGLQKVVTALGGAWKKHGRTNDYDDNDDDEEDGSTATKKKKSRS